MTTPPLDPRAKRWAIAIKAIAILGLGLLVAPYIFTAITGVAGLIAAGALLLTTWMVLPWAGAKAANIRLKLIKHEAATNPVETLQEEHRRQTAELNSRSQGIELQAAANRTLHAAIVELEKEFPDSPELPQMRADYTELCDLEESRRNDWKNAFVTLDTFAKEIKRAGRLWDVSLAAAKARGLSGLTQEEWQAKLKTETAFEAIRTKLNIELSALSIERMQADARNIARSKAAAATVPVTTERKLRTETQSQSAK